MSYVKAITEVGTQMFKASGQTGQAVVVDSMLISSNTLDANNANTLQASDFNGSNIFPVVAVGYQNNLYQPQARVTNGQLSSDLTVNAVGLLGHLDGSNQKELIAVMITTGNPTVIPANGNYKRYIGFDIISRAATNLTCNASNTYADQFASNEASTATSNAVNVNLSDYVKSAQLNSALAPYAMTSSLSAYPTFKQIDGSLSNYVTNSALNNYPTIDKLDSSLASYATNNSLSEYVTSSSFSATMTSFSAAQDNNVTSNKLNDTLTSYATQSFATTQFQNAVNTTENYAVKDNHDGSITFNGETLSIDQQLPNDVTDLFKIKSPGTWWLSANNGIKNVPSVDGKHPMFPMVIRCIGIKDSKVVKLVVQDYFGNEFTSYCAFQTYQGWNIVVGTGQDMALSLATQLASNASNYVTDNSFSSAIDATQSFAANQYQNAVNTAKQYTDNTQFTISVGDLDPATLSFDSFVGQNTHRDINNHNFADYKGNQGLPSLTGVYGDFWSVCNHGFTTQIIFTSDGRMFQREASQYLPGIWREQATTNYVDTAISQIPSFGPSVLPNGTDLNTVNKFGIYILPAGNNYPNFDTTDFFAGRSSWLHVISDGNGNVYQELTCAGVGSIMKRHYSATSQNGFSGWTNWM